MDIQQQLAPTKSYFPDPTTFDEAWRIAEILAKSDMVPKDFKGKPENCLIAMQWGADIGLPGLQALQNIAVINGRPSIWGDAAKALVIRRQDCEDIQEFYDGEGDNLTAVCIVKRKGKSPTESRFSIADATIAGLITKGGIWEKYQKRMLMMRARGFALRDSFPDALKGLSIAEEAQDMPSVEKIINPIATDKPSIDEKTASVLNGLNPKPPIDELPTIGITKFKKALAAIFDKPTQEYAKSLIGQLSGDDRTEARRLYDQFVAAAKAKAASKSESAGKTYRDRLVGAKTNDEFNDVLSEMSGDQMAEYEDLIVELQAGFQLNDPFGE